METSAIKTLADPMFATRLRAWVNKHRIKKALAGTDFTRDKLSDRRVGQLVDTKPHLFLADRAKGKTRAQIINDIQTKLAGHVIKY